MKSLLKIKSIVTLTVLALLVFIVVASVFKEINMDSDIKALLITTVPLVIGSLFGGKKDGEQ